MDQPRTPSGEQIIITSTWKLHEMQAGEWRRPVELLELYHEPEKYSPAPPAKARRR
jgi:hypothetical protein